MEKRVYIVEKDIRIRKKREKRRIGDKMKPMNRGNKINE